MNSPLIWEIPQKDINHTAIRMRATIAVEYEKKLFEDDKYFSKIINDYAVDAIRQAERIICKKIHGTVLEVGAGTGIYSCNVAKNKDVDKIYSVEYSDVCVNKLMSFVIEKFPISADKKNKIIPVVGSFDNIKLPDNSVDFIINVNSLHHSENREKTFDELYRVLKPNGYLISLDRASYNTLTNIDLNKKLDAEYTMEFKLQRGFKPDEIYTRRMNSEHDPLLAEWEFLLCRAGFKVNAFWIYELRRPIILAFFYKLLIGSFFLLFGNYLMRKKNTQIGHAKIPYYPFFSKNSSTNLLLIAKKLPYSKMP